MRTRTRTVFTTALVLVIWFATYSCREMITRATTNKVPTSANIYIGPTIAEIQNRRNMVPMFDQKMTPGRTNKIAGRKVSHSVSNFSVNNERKSGRTANEDPAKVRADFNEKTTLTLEESPIIAIPKRRHVVKQASMHLENREPSATLLAQAAKWLVGLHVSRDYNVTSSDVDPSSAAQILLQHSLESGDPWLCYATLIHARLHLPKERSCTEHGLHLRLMDSALHTQVWEVCSWWKDDPKLLETADNNVVDDNRLQQRRDTSKVRKVGEPETLTVEVRLHQGLGNQFFQLAFADRLAAALSRPSTARLKGESFRNEQSSTKKQWRSWGQGGGQSWRLRVVGSPDPAIAQRLLDIGVIDDGDKKWDAKLDTKILSQCRQPFVISDKPSYASSAKKTGFPPFTFQLLIVAKATLEHMRTGVFTTQPSWPAITTDLQGGGRRRGSMSCFTLEGYFQEMGYYAAPFPRNDNAHQHKSVRSPDSSHSFFPTIPTIVSAVAPPPINISAVLLKSSSESGFAPSLSTLSVTMLHVRRCDTGGSLLSTVLKTGGRRSKNSMQKDLEVEEKGHVKSSIASDLEDSAVSVAHYMKVVSTSFYPALPAEYYLTALGLQQQQQRFLRTGRNNDRAANNVGRENGTSSVFAASAQTKNNDREPAIVLIVTPRGCRRSQAVQKILSAFPGVARLAPLPPSNEESREGRRLSPVIETTTTKATTIGNFDGVKPKSSRGLNSLAVVDGAAWDFSLLRSASLDLVLSVGTFSWWAAWLSQEGKTKQENNKDVALQSKPRNVHIPLAGCQRRFVPFRFSLPSTVPVLRNTGGVDGAHVNGGRSGATSESISFHGAGTAASFSAAGVLGADLSDCSHVTKGLCFRQCRHRESHHQRTNGSSRDIDGGNSQLKDAGSAVYLYRIENAPDSSHSSTTASVRRGPIQQRQEMGRYGEWECSMGA